MILTTIEDTLKGANGVALSGKIIIQPSQAFTADDGTAVAQGPFTYQVVNGVVYLQLIPTEDADPEVTYKAEYFLDRRYTETWTVPKAGGPYTISDVRGTA